MGQGLLFLGSRQPIKTMFSMLSSELFWKRGEYQVIWPAEEDTEAISERRFWTCRRKAESPHVPELLLLTKEVKVKDIGTCHFT